MALESTKSYLLTTLLDDIGGRWLDKDYTDLATAQKKQVVNAARELAQAFYRRHTFYFNRLEKQNIVVQSNLDVEIPEEAQTPLEVLDATTGISIRWKRISYDKIHLLEDGHTAVNIIFKASLPDFQVDDVVGTDDDPSLPMESYYPLLHGVLAEIKETENQLSQANRRSGKAEAHTKLIIDEQDRQQNQPIRPHFRTYRRGR